MAPSLHPDLCYTLRETGPLLLDLRVPEVHAPPLVVWIHGGGWRSGKRTGGPALSLPGAGIAVASISYRFSAQALFPAQLHDVRRALAWLVENGAAYGVDTGRIGLWGHSAGGHLAALASITGGQEVLVEQGQPLPPTVRCAVDFCGPTALLRMDQHPGALRHDAADSPESELVGGPLQERAELAELADPIRWVHPGAPPMLICHGDQDPFVPWQQSALLHEALAGAGVPSRLRLVPGAGHVFKHPEVMAEVLAFFRQHLR